MQDQHALYMVLIDAIKRTPVIRQRFLIEKGIAKGFLSLADSLAEGDYWLLAYTNTQLEKAGQPLFRQLVSLRSGAPSPFRILSQAVEPNATGDSINISLKIGTTYGGLASGGKFRYTLYSDRDSVTGGTVNIDAFGEVTIKAQKGKKQELTAIVNRDGLEKRFILPISTQPESTSVATQKDIAPATRSSSQKSL